MKIQIAHLYPETLNLYGDKGNIASLCYRLQKRGIDFELKGYAIGEEIDFEAADIIFIGGGTDKDQREVCTELLKYKDSFKAYVENGGSVLAVCGGFELLGRYYELGGERIEALGILPLYSVHDEARHIGNVVLKSDVIGHTIVGFENHSGRIFLEGISPLGSVVSGFGNDGTSGFEGAVYKNVVASYLHGSLLPKNPKLTDYIILNALKSKYGEAYLEPLDDTIENNAHDYAVKRFSKNT